MLASVPVSTASAARLCPTKGARLRVSRCSRHHLRSRQKAEEIESSRHKDKSPSVFRHLETTKAEARRRYAACGSESQTKKYINVASGDSTDKGLDEVVARLGSRCG